MKKKSKYHEYESVIFILRRVSKMPKMDQVEKNAILVGIDSIESLIEFDQEGFICLFSEDE